MPEYRLSVRMKPVVPIVTDAQEAREYSQRNALILLAAWPWMYVLANLINYFIS